MSKTYEFNINPSHQIPPSSKDEKLFQLQSRLNLLQQNSSDYSSLNNRYKQLLNEYSILKDAKIRLEYEIKQRESEYNRHISDLKSENETLQLGLNNKLANSKKIFSENDIINREINLKNEEIKNLNERLKDISYEYDKNFENKNNIINLIQGLNGALISQKEQILKLKEDNISLTKMCQDNEKKIKFDENDVHILSNQMEENNYDIQNLNKKLTIYENNLRNLENKLTTCNEKNISMQKNIKNLENDFDESRNENDELKNELINERTIRIKIENENEKLNNILMSKDLEVKALNDENEKIKIFNSKYKNSKELNKISNDKLKNQANLLESQNDNLINIINNILNEDKKIKRVLTRKNRITSLLRNNNDTLEKSINDLDKYINTYDNTAQQNLPRFTYHLEQNII